MSPNHRHVWAVALIAAFGCSDADDPPSRSRIQLLNDPLVLEPFETGKSFPPAKTSTVTLILRAQVTPPVLGGNPLFASSVSVHGNLAFISYHTPGVGYGGGLDVIDISDPAAPALVSSHSFANEDVNAAVSDGTRVYLATASESFGFPETAAVRSMAVSGGGTLDASTLQVQGLVAPVATDVLVDGGALFVTTGRVDGRLVRLDPATLAVTSSVAVEDARALAIEAGTLAVHAGDRVELFDPANLASVAVYGFASGNDLDARSKVLMRGGKLFVTAGSEGVHVLDSTNGNLLDTIAVPASSDPDVQASDMVSNGVVSFRDMLFIAQGAGGFQLAATDGDPADSGAGTLVPYSGLSQIVFTDWVSSNAVASTDAAIVVANGAGGTRVIDLDYLSSVTVTLTSPQFGSTPPAPLATLDLTATVAGAPIALEKVEFYAGTGKLGEDTTAPYELTVSNLGGAYYDLTARAVFEGGYAKSSATERLNLDGVWQGISFGEDNSVDRLYAVPQGFYEGEGDLPAGYVRDLGDLYGARAGGLTYGWSADRTGDGYTSYNRMLPDRRYLETIQFGGNGTRWELEVPNGTYDVTTTVGRNSWRFRETTFAIDLEGAPLFNDTTTNAEIYFTRSAAAVAVADGRLTFEKISGDTAIGFWWVEVHTSGGTDYQPPTAPRNVRAEMIQSHSMIAFWNPSTDNVSVSGYEVSVDGVVVGTAAGPRLFVGDLEPATAYEISVVAVDSAGNRSEAAASTITTPANQYIQALRTYATLTIDGSGTEIDWTRAAVQDLDNAVDTDWNSVSSPAPADQSGTIRALWDATHLYLLVQVADDIVVNDTLTSNADGVSTGDDDSFELYFDLSNNRQYAYDGDDMQITFSYGATESSEYDLAQDGTTRTFTAASGHLATTLTADGWAAELALPWAVLDPGGAVTVATGTRLGFELQLQDDDGAGKESKVTFGEEVHDGAWTSAQRMSTLELYTP